MISRWLSSIALIATITVHAEQKTVVCVMHPIIKALVSAHDYIKKDHNCLSPVNPEQTVFLTNFMPMDQSLETITKDQGLSYFSDTELCALASPSAEELNKFLADRGFSLRLDQWNSADSFGVASILEILLRWKTEGRTMRMTIDDNVYAAVELDLLEVDSASFDKQKTVIKLKTQTDDIVYIALDNENPDDAPINAAQLLEKIHAYVEAVRYKSLYCSQHPALKSIYNSVVFPMVNIDITEELGWLKDLRVDKYSINQAMQQTIFKMNEKGALVKSAETMSCKKSICPVPQESFVIDRPFYLWIKRPWVKGPIFAAYIAQDTWKSPAGF